EAARPHLITMVNPAARALLGVSVEPGVSLDKVAPELVGVVSGHRVRPEGSFEVRIGGRPFRVRARAVAGSVLLYVDTCVDDVAVLRTAIAEAAHEIRGPVAVLAALAETISEAAAERNLDEDHLVGMTDSISRQARLLDNITADLLTASQ